MNENQNAPKPATEPKPQQPIHNDPKPDFEKGSTLPKVMPPPMPPKNPKP